MAAERHLPGREGEERHSSRGQELPDALQETLLVLRGDVLHHIVDEDQVERFVLQGKLKEIGIEERSFGTLLTEKLLRILYLAGGKVQTSHFAAQPRERQQIAAFAAADFQNTYMGADEGEAADIIQIISRRSLHQLIEILMPVLVSVSHRSGA